MSTLPLLKKGLTTGWINLFFNSPFDPLCIMLAMRTKLLLDAIDEMGHSYNLIRSIGFGWVDMGDIPGELPGNPADYYPPGIDNPIGGGGGGGAGAGAGAGSGGGWLGTPGGWPGYGLFPGAAGGGHTYGPGLPCCMMPYPPATRISIGYTTLEMDCDESQGLTIDGHRPECAPETYSWALDPDQGSIERSDFGATYTAPSGGPDCVPSQTITLKCYDAAVDSITISINSAPISASIAYTSKQMTIDELQTLTAQINTPGCGAASCQWAITAGGGTLSSASGSTTIYKAPHTNANCANNPTITLTCGGVLQDTLKLAVNAYTSKINAYWINHGCQYACQLYDGGIHCYYQEISGGGGYCGVCCDLYYDCVGAYSTWGGRHGGQYGTMALCQAAYNLNCVTGAGVIYDNRTAPQKAAGCCPAALL